MIPINSILKKMFKIMNLLIFKIMIIITNILNKKIMTKIMK